MNIFKTILLSCVLCASSFSLAEEPAPVQDSTAAPIKAAKTEQIIVWSAVAFLGLTGLGVTSYYFSRICREVKIVPETV